MKERMHTGELYLPGDGEIMKEQFRCLDWLKKYNSTLPRQQKKREKLLKKMLGDAGENCYIEAPFYANWGGKHVHLGKNVYINFSFTAVDDTHIYIGDYTMIAPNVRATIPIQTTP